MGIWQRVSQLGLKSWGDIQDHRAKRHVFFNQVLFIGFFATLFQIVFVWPFLEEKALVFLGVTAVIGVCLWLNSIGKFTVSKWIYVPSIYSMGVLTTIMLGGSALYHLQSFLILASCLILFDHSREKTQILIGLPFVVACVYLGEGSHSFVPDFSDHWWNSTARAANIGSLFGVGTILITFIIRINSSNEMKLEKALNNLQSSKDELELAKDSLEWEVQQRTEKLSEQTNELQRQNEEKIVLLKEIHHRVRNNLQVIISLINLQLSKFKDKEVKGALVEIQNRVRSMALVHQRMYQTSDFKEIELKDYSVKIIENISELYDDGKKFKIAIPDHVKMDFERAIPTGLIINEMVTNYYKHVQNGNGADHYFELSLELDHGNGTLRYKDDGDGFPAGFQIDAANSLGMLLIDSLVEQLDGEFKYYNDNGAVYEVVIPNILESSKQPTEIVE